MAAGGRLFCLLALFILKMAPAGAEAWERLEKVGDWNVDLSLSGGFIHQSTSRDHRAGVKMPDYMWGKRYASPLPLLHNEYLTDNPLLHGAFHGHAALHARSAGFGIGAALLMEHRGASYGTYANDEIAVLPKFHAAIDTSFHLAGQRFGTRADGGNFDDFRLYEGLTIYNLDVQGLRLLLKWKALSLGFVKIADLEYGIGLNINDQHDFVAGLEMAVLGERLRLDLSAGYTEYILSGEPSGGLSRNVLNAAAALEWEEKLRLYAQVGMRIADDPSLRGAPRFADLAGVSFTGAWGRRLDLDLVGEYRYYGRRFNQGFSYEGDCSFYRGWAGYPGCSMWNTAGNQVYPLLNFHRPFSQWAVYTDYQGRDVQTMIMRADASFALPGKLALMCHLDFNYLDVSNEDPFLYPFYDLGLGWTPAAGVTIAVSYTNRAMNLDRHYPTLYLLEQGTLMFVLQSRLAF